MGDYDDMILAARILWDEWRIRPTDGFRLVDLHEVTSVLVEAEYGEGNEDWFIPQSEVLRTGPPEAVAKITAANLPGKPVARAGYRESHVEALPSELREQIAALVEGWKRDDRTISGAKVSILRERVARCRVGTLPEDVWIALDSESVVGWRRGEEGPPPKPMRTWPLAIWATAGYLLLFQVAPFAGTGVQLGVVGALIAGWTVIGLLFLLVWARRRAPRPPAGSSEQPARPTGR